MSIHDDDGPVTPLPKFQKPHDKALAQGYYTLGDAINELLRLSWLCGRDKRISGEIKISIPRGDTEETWHKRFPKTVTAADIPKEH